MNKDLQYLYSKRPHVVIVGAGASRAAMGDLCPTMKEAVEKIGIDKILKDVTLKTSSKNLEDVYSELYERGEECKELRKQIENALFDYFDDVYLPSFKPTIYDMLILSLTKKDCIASFNWDSLLIQAYNRVNKITSDLPEMVFLHGNVSAGVCEDCKQLGPIINRCPKCNKPFSPVPLLYPVKYKNYHDNIFIRDQWNAFDDYLSRSGAVTIFGYSAPNSDIEASEIIKKAYSTYSIAHSLDRIEIIERPGFAEDEISTTWKNLLQRTKINCTIVYDFFDSSLAIAPRRTLEYNFEALEGGNYNKTYYSLRDCDTFSELETLMAPILDESPQNN